MRLRFPDQPPRVIVTVMVMVTKSTGGHEFHIRLPKELIGPRNAAEGDHPPKFTWHDDGATNPPYRLIDSKPLQLRLKIAIFFTQDNNGSAFQRTDRLTQPPSRQERSLKIAPMDEDNIDRPRKTTMLESIIEQVYAGTCLSALRKKPRSVTACSQVQIGRASC